jgi:hypothetical protein
MLNFFFIPLLNLLSLICNFVNPVINEKTPIKSREIAIILNIIIFLNQILYYVNLINNVQFIK